MVMKLSSCSAVMPMDCANWALCAGGMLLSMAIIPAASTGGPAPSPGPGPPLAAEEGAGTGGAATDSSMGSFIMAMKASLLLWMSASKAGLCCPIRSSTCGSDDGLFCNSRFSILNCG